MAVAEPILTPTPLPMLVRRGRSATFGNAVRRVSIVDRIALVGVGVITLVAILTPQLAPYDPLKPVGKPLTPPGQGFLLGTDEVGRDLFSRILYGARTSWFAAVVVILSGVIIGGIIGLVAGAAGGWLDSALMRFTDLFLALPGPVLAIAVVAALGPSLVHTLIAVGIVWWPFYARIVRGEIWAMRSRPHLEAARLAGVRPTRRALRHLLPGAIPALIVTASLDVGNLILTLAGLSFLGLGAPAPAPELGSMVAKSLPQLLEHPYVPVLPGVAVFVLAFVANVAGDGFRDLFVDR
jgi:peptide/nickel transport system permease protein